MPRSALEPGPWYETIFEIWKEANAIITWNTLAYSRPTCTGFAMFNTKPDRTFVECFFTRTNMAGSRRTRKPLPMTPRFRRDCQAKSEAKRKVGPGLFEQNRCATRLLADNNELKPQGEGKLHHQKPALSCPGRRTLCEYVSYVHSLISLGLYITCPIRPCFSHYKIYYLGSSSTKRPVDSLHLCLSTPAEVRVLDHTAKAMVRNSAKSIHPS